MITRRGLLVAAPLLALPAVAVASPDDDVGLLKEALLLERSAAGFYALRPDRLSRELAEQERAHADAFADELRRIGAEVPEEDGDRGGFRADGITEPLALERRLIHSHSAAIPKITLPRVVQLFGSVLASEGAHAELLRKLA